MDKLLQLELKLVESYELNDEHRVDICRVSTSDFNKYNTGDWVLHTKDDVLTSFPDGPHIDEGVVKKWYKNYIESLTQ